MNWRTTERKRRLCEKNVNRWEKNGVNFTYMQQQMCGNCGCIKFILYIRTCGVTSNSSVCRHLLWKRSSLWYYSTFQVLLKRCSGASMVSWCYWVDANPPFRLLWVSVYEGFLRYWLFLGWGGGGWVEVESGLMPVPRPPRWSSDVPAAERWTSSLSPRSTLGRTMGSGRPSARGVCGWLGGPVSGNKSPGVEPPESEAGPANDKELSEREES